MTSGPEKPRRLGRGLEALLAARPAAAPSAAAAAGGEAERGGDGASEMQRIKVSQVRPNPFQPRKEFRAEDLAELEASLNGVSGVIDHGLFTNEADEVIIETASGLERMKRGE